MTTFDDYEELLGSLYVLKNEFKRITSILDTKVESHIQRNEERKKTLDEWDKGASIMANHPYLEQIEKTLREINKDYGPFIHWQSDNSKLVVCELTDVIYSIASQLFSILQMYHIKNKRACANQDSGTYLTANERLEYAINIIVGEQALNKLVAEKEFDGTYENL